METTTTQNATAIGMEDTEDTEAMEDTEDEAGAGRTVGDATTTTIAMNEQDMVAINRADHLSKAALLGRSLCFSFSLCLSFGLLA